MVNGETDGYIEAATGSGKTLLIALLADAAVRAGKRVHVLAPTMQIADQLIGASGETGIGRFTSLLGDNAVKQNYGGRRGNIRQPVIVSTYPGFLEETKALAQGKGKLGDFDLVLGDECHKSLGTATSYALYRYMPDAIKIGFSATPDYAEDRRSEEIWGKAWFEFSLRTAIESGKASPIRPLLMATDTALELIDARGEFTERELAPLIDNFGRNGVALKLAQDFVADGRQGILACIPGRGNAHATIMADLLSQMKVDERSIVAQDIGSHLPRDEQQRRLQAFRNGQIDVLTFTRAIEEGWDSDKASFCLNLSPSTSPVRIKQLLGRIIRPKADGREGIFVDFVDEKEGINKRQYTALQALEIEDIDLDRVLGWGHRQAQPRKLGDYLRPEVYARLMRMRGKSLVDALASTSGTLIDPVVARWERTLAKEGMPAELPENIAFTPALDKKYQDAVHTLRREFGDEPTNDEVADYLKEKGIAKEQEGVVRALGQRVLLSKEAAVSITEARESVEDIVVRLALKMAMGEALDAMSGERDAAIIKMRFALTGEGIRTRKEIGEVYGIGRERVGQVEAQAIHKLRYQDKSQPLRDFLDEEYVHAEDSPENVYQKASRKDSVFKKIPNVEIPVYDLEDSRPYFTRLKEALKNGSEDWLQGKVSTVNNLRNKELILEDATVTKELRDLWAVRDRVSGRSRPQSPQAEQARFATIMALDVRIDALRNYNLILQEHITTTGARL